MNTPTDQIVDVLREVLVLLSRPGTDVRYSGYESAKDAAVDVRGHLAGLITCDLARVGALMHLFAPTGALQEISINSGWGGSFMLLSAQFDAAIDQMRQRGELPAETEG
jgi:hypothetical protein